MKSIKTLQANCTDCHRCVRSCPVKAIGIYKGQARLVENKCILCGRCVTECPQKVKQVHDQVKDIRDKIKEGRNVALSVAPSFISAFSDYSADEFFRAVRNLGFSPIEETAIGAEVVSGYYSRILAQANQPVISACCPVVVNIIERFYPDLANNIAAVVSPMIAHGRLMKERLGSDAYVVFAGPCVAKISEADAEGEAIDAVITFEQLRHWLDEIPRDDAEQLSADEVCPQGRGRYFPISGGILKSFMDRNETDTDFITVDGIENCMETFDAVLQGDIAPQFIEALACPGGCISGPVTGSKASKAAKRLKVIQYAQKSSTTLEESSNTLKFTCHHEANPVFSDLPTEDRISAILQLTGKLTIVDEKNCGACGYNSCREKAIAVYQGLAEINMCVPYMRSKAESFANIIVSNSLNAIIVVDRRMIIQDFNPAAEAMFNCEREMTKGHSLTEIIDCSHFIKAAQTGEKVTGKRIEYPQYNLITEQMIVPVPRHDVVMVIITNVTGQEKRLRELELMKLETIKKASQIIDKQMHVAQEIAGLLGETTAETKSALLEVIWLLKGKGDT